MSKSAKWFLAVLSILFVLVAGLSLTIFLIATFTASGNEVITYGNGEKVAVIDISGTIRASSDIIRQLKQYREDPDVKAILLRIESPGGSAVASEEIYEEVKKTRDRGEPVVVSVGSMAASGGYYIACGASQIMANRGSLVGGIGAIAEFLQVAEAMDKIGVGVRVVKTGPLKDAGSAVRTMTASDEEYFRSLLNDIHQQFVSVVRRERGLDSLRVSSLSDGSVLTGENGLSAGLVDTLGTFEDAFRLAGVLGGIAGEPALTKEVKHHSIWETLIGDAVRDAAAGLRNELTDWPVVSYRFVGPR